MKALMRTIGQAALLFTENERAAVEYLDDFPDGPLYEGLVEGLTREVCEQVAGLAPDWFRYYADAMAVLYLGLDGGTEDPVLAVKSYARHGSRRGVPFPYVVIWFPLKPVPDEVLT